MSSRKKVTIVREYLDEKDSHTISSSSSRSGWRKPEKQQQEQSQRERLKRSESIAAASAAAAEFASKKLQQRQTGQLFEDEEFPASRASLFPDRSCSHYVWKRPFELHASPRFFSDGVSRFDVRQGELGDCWLLAAISSLCLHRNLFEAVVPPDQEFGDASYCGMFRFRLWRFGEWKDVVVDDRLPTKNGRLCFMHSQDKNEFWSALLEKAYAKVCGCYEALVGGSQAEAMEDFTGGLCETFMLDKAPPNLYDIMLQASRAQSLIGSCIDSDVIEGELANGLITGHAYSITDVKVCRLQTGEEVTLVRVRNPWGNAVEWNGDWSDKSQRWRQVGRSEKERLSVDVGDDGEFWMSYQDFVREFTRLEVCHLSPDTLSAGLDPKVARKRMWEPSAHLGSWKRSISAGGCRNFISTFHLNPQFRVEIIDPDEEDDDDSGAIIVGLMQMNMRKLTRGAEFHTIGYAIYRLNDPGSGRLEQLFFRTNRQADKSAFVNLREVTGRHQLTPGHYVIVPSTYEPQKEAEFLLRVFSERPNKTDPLDSGNSMEHVEGSVLGKPEQKVENEEPLKKAFLDFAGEAARIHAKQLQQILNRSFPKELKKFTGFSLEACRSMLALVDANMSGYMEFPEFKKLWTEIRLLKTIFKKKDADGNGVFDACELREALRAAGYKICNCVFEAVAMRYMDPELGAVSFEDFVLLAVRLKISFEAFKEMPKVNEGKEVVLEEDKFLLKTLYL